jgi:hypothetical protein
MLGRGGLRLDLTDPVDPGVLTESTAADAAIAFDP